jgi:cyclopropane-fatty-acyl-phospholipid synthase
VAQSLPSLPLGLQSVLSVADVQIDGARVWDLRIPDTRAQSRLIQAVMQRGSLGLGDTYVAGLWECSALDQLFTRLLLAQGDRRLARGSGLRAALWLLRDRLFNLQSLHRSPTVARRHYDIHPQVYAAMLDPWRQYSCGYWEQASNLAEAQEHKLRLICEKLDLRPGLRLLDIGCGWGGLAAYAARHYGVEVVGITLSEEQLKLARRHWDDLPLRFELCDYRQLHQLNCEPFDRVVSVGMYEHVGPRNAGAFFAAVCQALSDGGLFLLHSIGYHSRCRHTDPWIDTHVFPHGRLPAPGELADALERDWLVEDWHNFGSDYDLTLMAWSANVEDAWPQLAQLIGDHSDHTTAERFRRFWRYYLLCCAGFFRSRQGQLWQLVLSKANLPRLPASGPYRSIRAGNCALNGAVSRRLPLTRTESRVLD